MSSPAQHVPAAAAQTETTPLRFVTAASLFDGHDAAINIMRRIIQAQGAEVIHLGHNRSVEDVVRAALQEDADAIALSSYQGGHVEYFKYMVDMLRERGAGHIRVFGGGGGTITPEEIKELQDYGVERIYHPNDGMKLGLTEMIEDVIERTRAAARGAPGRSQRQAGQASTSTTKSASAACSARWKTAAIADSELEHQRKQWKLAGQHTPVLGLTGTGGAGKSSVVDELLLRFLHAFPHMRIAVLAVDPTRRRSGGALLGDRIRMNSLRSHRVYMRSMATRRQHAATSIVLHDCIDFLKSQPYDLVIVETAGIGQSDSEIVDLVDFPVYVMTSDYGAASQLEKIDMIDFAELIVLNKFDKRGAEDALRDVRKQWKRNRTAFALKDDDVPVYPTIASQFNDPGVTWMFTNLCRLMREKGKKGVRVIFRAKVQARTTVRGSKNDSDPVSFLLPELRLQAAARHQPEGTARHRADPRRPRALPGRDRRAGPGHQPQHRDPGRIRQQGPALLRRPAGTGRPGPAQAAGRLPQRRPASGTPPLLCIPLPPGEGPRERVRVLPRTPARAPSQAPNPHPQPLSQGERGATPRPLPPDPPPALQRRRQGTRPPKPSTSCATGRPCANRSPPRSTSTRCAARPSAWTTTANRSATRRSPRWPRPRPTAGATSCASWARKTCPATTPTPAASTRTAAAAKTPPACSPARARPSAPTAASITSARAAPPRACPPRSTRSPCTAKTRPRARTSTARSATPASTSPPWTT